MHVKSLKKNYGALRTLTIITDVAIISGLPGILFVSIIIVLVVRKFLDLNF